MLERRRKQGARPAYPDAKTVTGDRRRFLEMLGKGVLGISILGVTRCDTPGGGSAGDAAGGDAAIGPDGRGDWSLQGGAPMPDGVERLPDTEAPDTIQYELSGVAPDSLHLEVQPPDGCTVQDGGGEFPPLPGEAPLPDVVVAPDTVLPDTVGADAALDVVGDASADADAFPPLAGDQALPRLPPRR